MDVSDLRRQHQEILQLTETMSRMLTKEDLPTKALDVSLKLGELSGKISIHLANEDKVVYPILLGFPDDRVRATARRFVDEMGSLAGAFAGYKNKYLSATRIKANPVAFIEETKSISAALRKRIELEEKELYPLL